MGENKEAGAMQRAVTLSWDIHKDQKLVISEAVQGDLLSAIRDFLRARQACYLPSVGTRATVRIPAAYGNLNSGSLRAALEQDGRTLMTCLSRWRNYGGVRHIEWQDAEFGADRLHPKMRKRLDQEARKMIANNSPGVLPYCLLLDDKQDWSATEERRLFSQKKYFYKRIVNVVYAGERKGQILIGRGASILWPSSIDTCTIPALTTN